MRGRRKGKGTKGQVVPLTSATGTLYPSEAYVEVAGRKSKAMADQLGTVSKSRLRGRLGVVGTDDIESIERAIRVQLDLR